MEITTYIFLIIGSFNLKKDERKFKKVKVLSILGFILLIWRIIQLLLPNVRVISPTPFEKIFGFIYHSILFNIYWALHLSLGISFGIFGSNNKEYTGRIILIAGILYAIAGGLNITLTILINVDIRLDPPYFHITYGMMVIFLLTIYIILLSSGILILVFSILSKRILLIIFAALNLSLIWPRYLLTLVYPGIGGY
ncbi:MAG: hypothetical protein ACFFDN_42485 [Candidatus Hodarchaeota archaeon]